MKKSIICILATMLCFMPLPVEAGVVNNTKIPYRNSLLHLARTISYDGTINLSRVQGVPYLTAIYYSKLSAHKISKFYNNYFKHNKIEGRLAQCSYCPLKNIRLIWRGMINGRDNIINIVNDRKNGISAIAIVAEIEENVYRNRYKPIIECFPELLNLGGRIYFKNEFMEGTEYSGVYMYNTASRPALALKTARSRLIGKGWKDPYNKVFSASRDGHVCMLGKGGTGMTIMARGEGGRTEMVVTVHGY